MTQPTPYSRQFDFAGFSASFPSDQQPGIQIDTELNAVKVNLDGLNANLAIIQRDDGGLRNTIVTLDTLAPDVLTTLGGEWTVRGAWAATTVYAIGDVVSNGGSTYVCAVAHTSGTFAVDLAAGKWVTIYGSSTAVIPDGSVTTAKLATAAVTNDKVGFTTLNLSSTIKAQGGLAAGTATAGSYPLGVKLNTGAVYGSFERATKAQGAVGLRFAGGSGGLTWDLVQEGNSDELRFIAEGGATPLRLVSTGYADANFLRVSGFVAPVSGSGVEISFLSGIGGVTAYDRSTSARLPLQLVGSTVAILANGVTVAAFSSTGGAALTEGTVNGISIGYRGIPLNTQSAGYTLGLDDQGKCVYSKNSGAQTIVVPTDAVAAIPIGAAIQIINNGNTAITISATGITLYQAGTTNTGNRTLGVRGAATLQKVEANMWFISGSGLT